MVFASRQQRVRVLEALELRAKQFRAREGTWPFRVPHDPLDLDGIIAAAAADGERPVDPASLRSRSLLSFSWDVPGEPASDGGAWELWVMALPSGILMYCDTDGHETRILASAKRGNPGEADGFFLERLAESRGTLFGIEMAGAVPDRVRSSIGDREFLADVFVELFEGTDAEGVLSAECSVLSAECSVLSAESSVLSAECSVLSAECSVLGAQCSVPSAECSVPSVERSVPSVERSVPSVERSVPRVERSVPSAPNDFRTTVAIWLDRVLTAPPAGRRQPRLRDQPEAL